MERPRQSTESIEEKEASSVLEPIKENETSFSYLGVRLEKAENRESEFVPQKEQYSDFISDKFATELQKKIAVSFLQGDPIAIEGGTSIGKTTSVRKMCAELGWEVHYANLNGATDVEDLMGRYIPNPHRNKPEDPEYIFAPGKVTSGLKQEEGKTKVIIVDELNAAAPNILIRLHEVLDALERDGDVVLSEDASETVKVSKEKTKIIGLMNPPGKGYFGREPLDPAQLRRWVYQKEVTDLPEETFSFSTEALFGLTPKTEDIPKEAYLSSRETILSQEQLKEIPGIPEILEKYKEFHQAAKEMLKQRHLAEDQPQSFTYDNRMEPRRVRDFVLQFYKGDITQTFQDALRYYYANKLETKADRDKLEELISHVGYTPELKDSKKRGLERDEPETEIEAETKKSAPEIKLEGKIIEQLKEAKEILGKDCLGPKEIFKAFDIVLDLETIPDIPFSREEIERAKELNQFLVLRADKALDGEPLTMEKIHNLLKDEFEKEEKGKVFYDRDLYKDEDFFKKQTPELSWALVSKEVIPDSTSKNYLQQTEIVIDYAKNNIFEDRELPKEYKEAIKEFEEQKEELKKLIDSDWKTASEKLEGLKITQLTRQTPVEVLYDILIYFQNNDKERLLENEYTWTNYRSSDGGLVGVGRFDSDGAVVWRGGHPGDARSLLGVSFSCSP